MTKKSFISYILEIIDLLPIIWLDLFLSWNLLKIWNRYKIENNYENMFACKWIRNIVYCTVPSQYSVYVLYHKLYGYFKLIVGKLKLYLYSNRILQAKNNILHYLQQCFIEIHKLNIHSFTVYNYTITQLQYCMHGHLSYICYSTYLNTKHQNISQSHKILPQ